MSGAGEWTPTHDRQHPPFEPGNTFGEATRFKPGNQLQLTHGAYSPAVYEPVAKEIVEALASNPATSWLADPAVQTELWRFAERQARAELLAAAMRKHQDDHGCDVSCGDLAKLEARHLELDKAAGKIAATLGLTPLTKARLMRDVAQTQEASTSAEEAREALRALVAGAADQARTIVVEEAGGGGE